MIRKILSAVLTCVLVTGLLPVPGAALENVSIPEPDGVLAGQEGLELEAGLDDAMREKAQWLITTDMAIGENKFSEKERNDSTTSANILYHDYTVNGELTSGDIDYYTFTLTKDSNVHVTAVGGSNTIWMAIYDSGYNRKGQTTLNMELSMEGHYGSGLKTNKPMAAGTYYLCFQDPSGRSSTYSFYLDAPGAKMQTAGVPAIKSARSTAAGVNLEWEAAAGAASYVIYRSDDNKDYTRIGETDDLIYIDNTAVSGKSYYYTVAAVSSSGLVGLQSQSRYVAYTITAPVGLEAENLDRGIGLSWDEVTGAAGYVVLRSEGGPHDLEEVATVTKAEYVDTAVKPGAQYYYSVACLNPGGKGRGRYCEPVPITCQVVRLSAPTGLSAASDASGIRLTWNTVDGAQRYAIYRSVDGGAFTWLAGPYTNSYTDANTEPGRSYSYQVCCYNLDASGAGERSKAVSLTYIVQLPAPQNVAVASVTEGMELTWDAVEGARRYAIYRSVDGKQDQWLAGCEEPRYVDTDVRDGVTYYYTVSCYVLGASGVGEKSRAVSGTFEATEVELVAPEKPHDIKNVVHGIHVYWKATENADKYGLWRSETGRDGTYKWIANPRDTHFTDTAVESGKTYFYKVTSMDVQTNTHSELSEARGIVYTATPDITGRQNTAAGVKLGWNKIEGASGYAIYRKSYDGDDVWARVGTIPGNETFTWTDESVKNSNGAVYRYTIRALGGEDMKTLSGCRNTGRTMVRLSSQVLKSAAGTNGTAIKCAWTTSKMVTGYEVRFMVGDEVIKTFTIGNYKTGVKTFAGLESGREYTIQVRTYKKVEGVGSFYSDWSQAKSVTL